MTHALRAPFAKLSRSFDAARLASDLERVLAHYTPPPQQSPLEVLRAQLGIAWGDASEYDALRHTWTALSLRSQGGDWRRTDPGAPGLDDYADTEVLERAPYWRALLRELDLALRSVRLVGLGVGTDVPTHVDPGMDFAGGCLRLALPVRTHARVVFVIDGRKSPPMEVGELWYTEVARPHSLANPGPLDRYHLVLDAEVDERVLALFPPEYVAHLQRDAGERAAARARAHAAERALDAQARRYCGAFDTGPGFFGLPAAARWDVVPAVGRLQLCVNGNARFALRPLGAHRFAIPGAQHDLFVEIDPEARTFTLVRGAERSTTRYLPRAAD